MVWPATFWAFFPVGVPKLHNAALRCRPVQPGGWYGRGHLWGFLLLFSSKWQYLVELPVVVSSFGSIAFGKIFLSFAFADGVSDALGFHACDKFVPAKPLCPVVSSTVSVKCLRWLFAILSQSSGLVESGQASVLFARRFPLMRGIACRLWSATPLALGWETFSLGVTVSLRGLKLWLLILVGVSGCCCNSDLVGPGDKLHVQVPILLYVLWLGITLKARIKLGRRRTVGDCVPGAPQHCRHCWLLMLVGLRHCGAGLRCPRLSEPRFCW